MTNKPSDPAESDRLQLFMARWRLGMVGPEEIVDLATQLLVGGSDSVVVAQIAGLSGREIEAAPTMWRLLSREIGLQVPSEERAGRLVVSDVVRRIIKGKLEPYVGARYIWTEVALRVSDLSEELREFVGLASEWEDHPDDRAWYEQEIVHAARRWLRRVARSS